MANPYKDKVSNFPGRLFPWLEPEAELHKLQELLLKSSEIFAELGSGSGGHIIERAASSPQSFWIGFELRYKRAVRTLEKAEKSGVTNVYIVRTDGRKLEDFLPPARVSGLYINFPDPWTKANWRKHRMLSVETLDSAAKVIRPGGFISIKTDHQDYFQDFLRLASKHPEFIAEDSTTDFHNSGLNTKNVLTEFEKLFLFQKLPIAYLRLRRRGVRQEG